MEETDEKMDRQRERERRGKKRARANKYVIIDTIGSYEHPPKSIPSSQTYT